MRMNPFAFIGVAILLISAVTVIVGVTMHESVFFLSSGQVYGGTLAFTVQKPVDEGVDYRVIYANNGMGNFDDITGREQFDEIVEDGLGVVCRRSASP